MEMKLVEYGFQDWQIKGLLTRGKLNTTHGIYRLTKDGKLYLQKKVNGKCKIVQKI